MKTDRDHLKDVVGKKAADLVKDKMLVGLGTGTTATYFIHHLIDRCQQGLSIQCVSSSNRSAKMAEEGGIPILPMESVTSIDLTIDGADEVDKEGRMIKGGGGALVREKIVASSSREIVIIVDEKKLVTHLGKFGLPVEILPFGYLATIYKIEKLGYTGHLRVKDQMPYITDNGNYIYDIHTPTQFITPERDHENIVKLPGVVDTGLFFNLPTSFLVSYADGTVKMRE